HVTVARGPPDSLLDPEARLPNPVEVAVHLAGLVARNERRSVLGDLRDVAEPFPELLPALSRQPALCDRVLEPVEILVRYGRDQFNVLPLRPVHLVEHGSVEHERLADVDAGALLDAGRETVVDRCLIPLDHLRGEIDREASDGR